MIIEQEGRDGSPGIIYSGKTNSLPLESIRDRALDCSRDKKRQLVKEKAFFFTLSVTCCFLVFRGTEMRAGKTFNQKLFRVERVLIHDWAYVVDSLQPDERMVEK